MYFCCLGWFLIFLECVFYVKVLVYNGFVFCFDLVGNLWDGLIYKIYRFFINDYYFMKVFVYGLVEVIEYLR